MFRKMKIGSIIIVVATAIVAGAWVFYFISSQPDRPPCDDNILTTDIVGCDIKGSTK
jgi:hypothetical protein